MILLFPWAQTYSSTLLAHTAAHAARTSPVPITVHLDHATDPAAIRDAADMGCFDSIMVDMSHHPHEENLRLTRELTAYCHERGTATEAEPGRIEGGEDGVVDPGELEGVMTGAEEAREFVDTGIDWLAPAFGNVHGKYGPRGIQLEYGRLEMLRAEAEKKGVRLVLHGTDGFGEEEFGRCVRGGISKVNINRVVNEKYIGVMNGGAGVGLTALIESGTKGMQEQIERCMDLLGSTGKA